MRAYGSYLRGRVVGVGAGVGAAVRCLRGFVPGPGTAPKRFQPRVGDHRGLHVEPSVRDEEQGVHGRGGRGGRGVRAAPAAAAAAGLRRGRHVELGRGAAQHLARRQRAGGGDDGAGVTGGLERGRRRRDGARKLDRARDRQPRRDRELQLRARDQVRRVDADADEHVERGEARLRDRHEATVPVVHQGGRAGRARAAVVHAAGTVGDVACRGGEGVVVCFGVPRWFFFPSPSLDPRASPLTHYHRRARHRGRQGVGQGEGKHEEALGKLQGDAEARAGGGRAFRRQRRQPGLPLPAQAPHGFVHLEIVVGGEGGDRGGQGGVVENVGGDLETGERGWSASRRAAGELVLHQPSPHPPAAGQRCARRARRAARRARPPHRGAPWRAPGAGAEGGGDQEATSAGGARWGERVGGAAGAERKRAAPLPARNETT